MTARKKPTPAKRPLIVAKATAKKAAKPGEDKKTGAKPIAQQKLDAFGADKVCELITDGKTLTEIAQAARVSFGSLQTWLEAVPERSARAREARRLAARLYDEEALTGIQLAKDQFSLAKAKEAAHHLRWRAAKIDPKGYGDKLGIGAASDLPPLPQPAAPQVTVNFEIPPAEAYAKMLTKGG